MKMESVLKDQVPLCKGINLSQLLSSATEFQVDMDFNERSSSTLINGDDDLYPDMGNDDDSDSEDVLKHIEQSIDKMMLSSPEYHSFDELSAKMVDCVSGGFVKLLIIEEGEGPLIPLDAEVKLHYAAYWEKAKLPFDSTLTMNRGSPLTIRLGAGTFLPGLEIGLSMVKGTASRFLLLLHPRYAWGDLGVPPRIRPEPCLLVVVVYDVTDLRAAVQFNDLPSAEQTKFEVAIKTVNNLRSVAKDLYKKNKYKNAISNYQRAITVLTLCQPQSKNEVEEIKNLKISLYVNLCVCYYRINMPKQIIFMCENIDKIIDIGTHCKGLFYYGRAYELLGKTEIAVSYYRKALKLEPMNKEIGRTLAELDSKSKTSKDNEKAMWEKVFNREPVDAMVYDIDDDIKNDIRDICQELVESDGYSRFDLGLALSNKQVDFVKDLVSEFKGLVVEENGEGKRKEVTIIKKSYP